MGISRRRLLIGSSLAATAAVPLSQDVARAGAAVEPELWREFLASPYNHPQIPNVSFAGYRHGARLPTPPVRANVLLYGAKPNGSADAAPAINRALEDVGRRGGGAVLVPAGTYRIDDVIRIGYDNTVLRGASSSWTILQATRSLEESVGVNIDRYGAGNSAWSWSGGLIWICGKERLDALVQAIRARDWPMEDWAGNKGDEIRPLVEVTGTARRGDFRLAVADSSGLSVGQGVMLELSDEANRSLLGHMAGDIPGAATYNWSTKTKLLGWLPFRWPVRIAGIQGRTIELAQPLPLDVRPGWAPRLVTPLKPPVVNSGVERLTLRMPGTVQQRHLKDKGFNGVSFQCAWDCWADDVAVVDCDNGFILTSAKGITMSRTRVSGRGWHHAYACREQSHDNLVDTFRTTAFTAAPAPGANRHGINVEGLSCGNVWSNGRMAVGTFDTHRGMPFNNVRTQIVIHNDGLHGGSADAGPLYGARFAHWNVTVTNGRLHCTKIDHVAPCSATVGLSEVAEAPPGSADRPDFAGNLNSRLESYGDPGVTPSNLYVAQRRLRLDG